MIKAWLAFLFGKPKPKPGYAYPAKPWVASIVATPTIMIAAHGIARDEFTRKLARGQDPGDFDELWSKHALRIADIVDGFDTARQ